MTQFHMTKSYQNHNKLAHLGVAHLRPVPCTFLNASELKFNGKLCLRNFVLKTFLATRVFMFEEKRRFQQESKAILLNIIFLVNFDLSRWEMNLIFWR